MILVMSTKCDNANNKKTLESQHSPMISKEMAPLFLPYSTLIPRIGLGRLIGLVLSNFHVITWSSKFSKESQANCPTLLQKL